MQEDFKMKKKLKTSIDSASSTINKINTNTIILKKTKISDFWKNKTYFVDMQEIEIINYQNFIKKEIKSIY